MANDGNARAKCCACKRPAPQIRENALFTSGVAELYAATEAEGPVWICAYCARAAAACWARAVNMSAQVELSESLGRARAVLGLPPVTS